MTDQPLEADDTVNIWDKHVTKEGSGTGLIGAQHNPYQSQGIAAPGAHDGGEAQTPEVVPGNLCAEARGPGLPGEREVRLPYF